jgi:hypothetical protein
MHVHSQNSCLCNLCLEFQRLNYDVYSGKAVSCLCCECGCYGFTTHVVGLCGIGGPEGGGEGEAPSGEESEAAVRMVLDGAVAMVVFKQAAAELPKEVAVRKRFLDILSGFTFPGAASINEVTPSGSHKVCRSSDFAILDNIAYTKCRTCSLIFVFSAANFPLEFSLMVLVLLHEMMRVDAVLASGYLRQSRGGLPDRPRGLGSARAALADRASPRAAVSFHQLPRGGSHRHLRARAGCHAGRADV